MKYVPKEITENVNISKRNPLKEFSGLLVGLVLIILTTIVVIGFSIDILITVIPVSWEGRFSKIVNNSLLSVQNSIQDSAVSALFDSLVVEAGDIGVTPSLIIIESDEVNAGALPGGVIIVNSGLLKEVVSENELAFVLGHELGHLKNRDHLRGLGKQISLTLVAALVNSRFEAGVSEKIFSLSSQRYSKKQEMEADQYGLIRLIDHYGHAAGATTFFERVAEKSHLLLQFNSSHPLMMFRVKALNKTIKDKECDIKELVPYSFQNQLKTVVNDESKEVKTDRSVED